MVRRWFVATVGLGLVALAGAAWSVGVVEPGVGVSSGTVGHVHAGCSSCMFGALHAAGDGASVGFDDFQILTRWTGTASQPSVPGVGGSPVRLTWGFAQEGSTIVSTRAGEATGPSSLIAFLDSLFDPMSTGGADLTQRGWFDFFASSFGRLDALSGLSYVYEPNDDGANISGVINAGTRGVVGVRPDIRIGGHAIDGQSGTNTLAYNYFPPGGDMVIDTDNTSFLGNAGNNAIRLRNMIMHEAGHGVGLSHVESADSRQLMEPFISTAFDGPQFDDILALHRNYGDAREENGGNDTTATADFLGVLNLGDAVALGTDASNDSAVVLPTMTDFISVDDNSDVDVFRFNVTDPAAGVVVTATPKGPTYQEGPQGSGDNGTQTPLITSALGDLVLQLLDAAGAVVATADDTIAGGSESISWAMLGGGDWFVRVLNRSDNVQMYRLDLSVVPEPASWVVVAMGAMGLACRGRRRVRP